MNKEDLTPLQYYVLKLFKGNNSQPIHGDILFQKIAFLILERFPKLFREVYFVSHKFGPYSESLALAKEELVNLGYLIKEKETRISHKGETYLNEKDLEFDEIEDLEQSIDQNKDEFADFNTEEILAFIYKRNPEYISSSIRADKVDYKKRFLDLYEKGKLGISKISELLGWSFEDTYDYIKKYSKRILIQ